MDEDTDKVCCEVYPGLYVGSLRSLGSLQQLGITHVVSVINFPPPKDLSFYITLHLPLQDEEDENLLAVLPRACAFIHTALTGSDGGMATGSEALLAPSSQEEGDADAADEGAAQANGISSAHAVAGAVAPGTAAAAVAAGGAAAASSSAQTAHVPGKVLVHCQAGMSRSVSVAAAYMMRVNGYDAHEAIRCMKDAGWKRAEPNDGFMAQLDMFHDMRCRVDPDHPVYRMWRVEQVGRKKETYGLVDESDFAQLPADIARTASSSGLALYRCRKCRAVACTAANVLPVDAAMGHKHFRERRRVVAVGSKHPGKGVQPGADDESAGSSLFLEPMSWMAKAIVGEVEGKMYCPNTQCKARLGSFNWSGITNEKGQWVTPAFQLHISKLDIVEPAASAPGASHLLPNIRRPLLPAHPPKPAVPATAATAAAAAAQAQAQPTTTVQSATVQAAAGQESMPVSKEGPAIGAAGTSQGPQSQPQSQPSASQGSQPVTGTAWFTHLIFDCDGVLVDSERSSCEALRRAIREVTGFDIPHNFPTDYTPVFGMDVRGCVGYYAATYPQGADWSDQASISARVLEAKEKHYAQLTGEAGIPAIDGAAHLIRAAEGLGMAVGVGSSGAPEKIARNLEVSGLSPLLNPAHIVSAVYVAAGKPAPDVYIEALRRTGCTDPRRSLVIEDTVNGLKAARGAGCFAVGVTNSLPAHVLAPHADVIVDHLSELNLATLQWPSLSKE